MRKFNILGAILVAFTVMFASCSKSDSIGGVDEASEKSVAVSFDLKLMQESTSTTKSATTKDTDIDDEFFADPAILESCDISEVVYVYVEVMRRDKGTEDDYLVWDSFTLNVQQFDGVDNIATDLIEFPDPESWDYTISKFVALDAEGSPIMATPVEGSVYADYLSSEYQLYFDLDPTLYDKTRVEMQVLCFEAPLAPEFGFLWFDIEIIKADWMCMFVNICDDSNAAEYHQVLAYYAEIYVSDEQGAAVGDPYFTGYNYDEEGEVIDPEIFCFPLPGDYPSGIVVMLYDSEGGELIERVNLAATTIDLYDYAAGQEMVEYFHLEIDCDDPIYHSSFVGGNSILYKVDIYEAGGTASFSQFGTVERFTGHMAQHPETGLLYLLDNKDLYEEIRVVDQFTGGQIGSFTHRSNRVHQIPITDDGVPQLVWGPGNNDNYILWAGDAKNDSVYQIRLFNSNATFTYTKGDEDGFKIAGGDLIALDTKSALVSLTNQEGIEAVAFNGEISALDSFSDYDIKSDFSSSDIDLDNLAKFNGAAVWKNKVVTSMQDNTVLLWDFSSKTVSELEILVDYPIITGFGGNNPYGDMASRYFLSLD